MADEAAGDEESGESASGSAPAPAPLQRPPHELVLLLSGSLATGCAAAAVFGSFKGWTSPTLGVVFVAGVVESLVAVGLAIRVLLLEEKRLGLFVPGVALAAVATASLTGIFLLSGSI